MAAASRNFSVIHEKLVHCRMVCMCPTMDLVASLHADGQLSVHRTMGWQRSFTLTQEDMGNRTFSCMTWSPNGKTIAVGFTDGTIQLFGVETGAEECSLACHESRSVAALTWVAQQPREGAARSRADEEADQLAEVSAAYADRCEHVLGSSNRLPGGSGGAPGGAVGGRSSGCVSSPDDSFALLKEMNERPVSVLASADASGVVVLSICGAYQLITIDLRSHRGRGQRKGKGRGSSGGRHTPPKVDSPARRRSRTSPGQSPVAGVGAPSDGDADGLGSAVRPLQLTLSADLSLLSALVDVDGQIELIQVDLPLLWRRRHELKPLAMQFTAFRAVIGRFLAYVPRLPQLWTSTLQGLESKLCNLEDLLARCGYDKDITPRDELINLVTCGHVSDALSQFLSTTLTEAQLTRMRKLVDSGTGQIEAMLQGDISFLARSLLFRACDLHRLAVMCSVEGGAEDDGELGLHPAPVEAFLRDCEMLCVKVEQTLREVQISRSRLRFILLWLEQIVPTVTVSTAADGAEQADWRPPHHTLAKSVLSILKEPLPSDAPASGARNSPVPTSRVEAIIGVSVPGLGEDENSGDEASSPVPLRETASKGAFAAFPGGPTSPANTIKGQVNRLQESMAEVFRAPRNSLSRAVGKLSRTRICVSSEGGAVDPVRTRAAAKAAAAAAAGGAFSLLPMRCCMCSQDKLPAGCTGEGEQERIRGGGTIVAAVATDNFRGGKGSDVVWIVAVPTPVQYLPSAAGGGERQEDGPDDSQTGEEVRVAGVRAPPGFQVRQVAFYGSVPGVPTQNEARLAIVLESVGDRDQASTFHLLALDDLGFSAVGSLASFDDEALLLSPTRKGRGGGGSKYVVGAARGRSVEALLLSELSSRSRELPQHVKGVTVALSGARGMACAVSSSKHLIVLDLEEDEDEDEEEKDEDEDADYENGDD